MRRGSHALSLLRNKPGFNDVESVFDSGRAKTEADAYLRAGLDARGARLIAYLLQNSDGPLRLLDIGSGAGGVHYELLRRGLAASAVAVDASSAYIAAARSVGERLGLDSRVHYVHGDFTAARRHHLSRRRRHPRSRHLLLSKT